MKNKIVKYMINIGMNPTKFADLVNFSAEAPPQKALNLSQEEGKSISIFDIILIIAIIIVGIFLAAIFL